MNSNEKIKSVQFIDSYFPLVDGVIETVHNYALNMDSVVVCPKMTRDFDRQDFPYEVLTAPALRAPFLGYALAEPFTDPVLNKKLKEIGPDILHVHSPATLGEYALSIGRRLDIPVVATFHSKVYDAVFEFTKSKGLAKAASYETAKFYERCDAVWACSEGTADTLRSYGYKGDITVVTNGTAFSVPEDRDAVKAEAFESLGLAEGKHMLLFVGQMIWYKNIRLILDAFKMLSDISDDYYLVMAGEGKDLNAIQNYAASLGLSDKQVLTVGKISDRRLLQGLYLNADLFFFPSVFDNTPLVMREAAALGIPSLVTEGSNAAEAVEKNVNGFTAAEDPRAMCDEILRIFSDITALHEAGEKARETIPVQWSVLTPHVEENYRMIIENYRNKNGAGE